MENNGYTLTWLVNRDDWAHQGSEPCVWVEYITAISADQHMLERRCPCGAVQKFVSA